MDIDGSEDAVTAGNMPPMAAGATAAATSVSTAVTGATVDRPNVGVPLDLPQVREIFVELA